MGLRALMESALMLLIKFSTLHRITW